MDEALTESQKRRYAQRELARRQLARNHFTDYLALVHGSHWISTKFSTFIADELQKFLEADTGNAYDILVLETPPQHGKSMTVTESLPSWWLMKHPDTRIILSSYNEESADRFSRRNREKVVEWGPLIFGVGLGGLARATEFEVADSRTGEPHRGRLISRGIMSGITGNPANLLIIDDPIKNREEADSESSRNKIWGEWLNSLKSRLAAKAKVIVIMTPWHEDDLAARVLRTEDNVRLIRLPVEAEDDDSLGRQPGDALCPELGKGKKWLEQFRASYLSDPTGGARAWAALYMCSPRVEGGNIIQRSWWKYYRPEEIKGYGITIISVDASFKGDAKGKDRDFVSVQVWSKLNAKFYLRHGINRRLEFTETVTEIERIRLMYPETAYIVIEDKANGSAIINVLQSRFPGVFSVNPKGGKEARVYAAQPPIECGNVFLPEGSLFAEEMIDQFCQFPAGKHDDMVDACTQALSFLLWHSGAVIEAANTPEAEEWARDVDALTSDSLYDPYGLNGNTIWG